MTQRNNGYTSAAVTAWFASFAIVFAACGASIRGLCEEIAECEGDDDVEECVKDTEKIEEAASQAGCADAFDDLLSCADDTVSCEGNDADISCDAETKKLFSCIEPRQVTEDDGSSPGG